MTIELTFGGFPPAFYSLLDQDAFVQEVATCLTESVLKKMEPRPKISLIRNLIHQPTLEAGLSRRTKGRTCSPGDDMSDLVALATLTSAVCRELLVSADKLKNENPAVAAAAAAAAAAAGASGGEGGGGGVRGLLRLLSC